LSDSKGLEVSKTERNKGWGQAAGSNTWKTFYDLKILHKLFEKAL